jgi:hypothetical protein
MSVTAQQVFDLTMKLIGEVDSTGTINATDTADYKAQSPAILTIGQIEIAQKEGITPIPGIISSLSDTLVISDRSALTILPYNLAAHLLLEENSKLAQFYNEKYDELKRKIPVTEALITDLYPTNWDGYWSSWGDSDGSN